MSALTDRAAALKRQLSGAIIGKDDKLEIVLCALFAGGHVLMEDMPGTGKTALARALARSTDLAFGRVQCTPDLLPSDILGASLYNMKELSFEFRKGPVFTNLLLADELNRATPRTQAALLECMEEGQVTLDGETRRLPRPFFVIATQNPVETQGTFPLPEAQLDRFMIRLSLGYPTNEETAALLASRAKGETPDQLTPVMDGETLLAITNELNSIELNEPVAAYIASLCALTRTLPAVRLGVSTRGAIQLMRLCRALAFINGRSFVTPDDVKALAVPALSHRLIVDGAFVQASAQEDVIRQALTQTPVPTEALK